MTTTLRQLLLSDPAIVGLVGQRVYPLRLPEGYTTPAITLQLVTKDRDYSMDVTSEGAHRSHTYQLNCCADTYLQAVELADAVIAKISNYQNSFNGVDIRNIEVQNETDLDGIEAESKAQTMYVRALDILIQIEV